jgi:hypothetical protein
MERVWKAAINRPYEMAWINEVNAASRGAARPNHLAGFRMKRRIDAYSAHAARVGFA